MVTGKDILDFYRLKLINEKEAKELLFELIRSQFQYTIGTVHLTNQTFAITVCAD